jgi:hypothetical protein
LGVIQVTVASGETVSGINFGNQAAPSAIQGMKWNDLDGDGLRDGGEPGLAGWTIYIDQNENGALDDGELSTTTASDGSYSFAILTPGHYIVAELQQPGWEQTAPSVASLDDLLSELNANHGAISALVPNRFDFFEGETGFFIGDGGNDMYDGGNFLNTNLAASIPYTNGQITASDVFFGEGSRYFTAKYPGLFVMAASEISIDSFTITGDNGADGSGSVNGAVLSTAVNGQPYTIFLKRVYNAFDPSVNHIIIVPGSNNGASHFFNFDTNDDFHTVTQLGAVEELYYVLVASAFGGFVADADVLNIANAFLGNVRGGDGTTHSVSVGAGEVIPGLDFGNRLTDVAVHPGDFNRDGAANAADFVLWRKTLGTTVANFTGADGDGSGVVDEADYGVWRANFAAVPTLPVEVSAASASADQLQASTATATSRPVGYHAAGVLFEDAVALVSARSGPDVGSRLSAAELATDSSSVRETALLAWLAQSHFSEGTDRDVAPATIAELTDAAAPLAALDSAFTGLSDTAIAAL